LLALAGLIAVAAAVMSFSRYVDQRWKMTELTYGTGVIVATLAAPAVLPNATAAK
jgi:hypothetical protein